MTNDRFTPSGDQWPIVSGQHRAVIVGVGGGVRSYDIGGTAVLDGYAETERAIGGAGMVLVPWPNRIRDGRYSFNGTDQQLALTEPTKRNAIHGLLRWASWSLVEHATDSVTVAASIVPLPGYPHGLRVETRWSVGPAGLRAEHLATNVGKTHAPFGLGAHPYLVIDGSNSSRWDLRLPVEERLLTDDRGLPTGRERVEATAYDFRTPRVVGDLVLDTAFTGLRRDDDGRARISIADPDGATVTLWLDESFRWVQVFTADTLAPPRRRRSFAVEPMTCPPDAFNSGDDLVVLDPGQTWTGSWGVVRTPS